MKKRLGHLLAPVLILALSIAAPAGRAASAGEDPLLGKWFGQSGPPEDRIETGFEFRRGDKGVIEAFLYRPVMNTYGAPMGAVTRDGEKYVIAGAGASAILRDGALEVSRGGKVVFTLSRATELPAEGAVPTLPVGPAPRWRVKVGGPIYAAPAVRDGMIYVGTTGGVMNAMKLEDGSFVWGFPAGRPIYGEALTTPEAVFFVCDNGFLFKVDRATGKEVWRYDLGDAQVPRITQILHVYGYEWQTPRPTLQDGIVYVGSGDGSFHAVDAASGKRSWRFAAKGMVRDTALVDGPRVVFGTMDGILYALDRATGKEIWEKNLEMSVTSSPSRIGDRLVVGTRASGLHALAPETGEELWKRSFWGSWVESTAVPFGDFFYIGSSDLRRVTGYDREGRILWRTDVFGSPWGRPAVTEKRVYIGAEGNSPYPVRNLGSFCALDRATGRIVWRWVSPDLPGVVQTGFVGGPALAGDLVVVAGLDGSLSAFPAE